jgi:DNA-binding beta-propeller fold protein YncE
MKQTKSTLFSAALCAAAMTTIFTACSDDNDEQILIIDPVDQPYQAYFLAEGSMGANNSVLCALAEDTTLVADLYQAVNGRGLGDTGQDLLYYGGHLFASVSGSGYLSEMDMYGYELYRLTFDAATWGSPRYLAMDDSHEYLYLSLYGTGTCGYVAKVDYKDSLRLVGAVEVGTYPEQMAVLGGKLVVCNSGYGYGNTLSVIDLTTFTVEQTLTVDTNPTRIVTGTNGLGYYLTTSYDANWVSTVTLHELNPADWSSRTVQAFPGAGICMSNAKEALYLTESATSDYVNYQTSFSRVNYTTGQYEATSYLNDADLTAELRTQNVYMLAVNPYTQDIYISTSNYYTNATLYAISAKGSLVKKFADAGGMNISSAAFTEPIHVGEVTIY